MTVDAATIRAMNSCSSARSRSDDTDPHGD
jgi:hypothetical protein